MTPERVAHLGLCFVAIEEIINGIWDGRGDPEELNEV